MDLGRNAENDGTVTTPKVEDAFTLTFLEDGK